MLRPFLFVIPNPALAHFAWDEGEGSAFSSLHRGYRCRVPHPSRRVRRVRVFQPCGMARQNRSALAAGEQPRIFIDALCPPRKAVGALLAAPCPFRVPHPSRRAHRGPQNAGVLRLSGTRLRHQARRTQPRLIAPILRDLPLEHAKHVVISNRMLLAVRAFLVRFWISAQ